MRVKHLTDLLTWDQIWVCKDIHETRQSDSFSPIRVCVPDECSPEVGTTANGKSVRTSWYSPKVRFAMELLQTARTAVAQRTGWDPEKVEWIPASESFNTIRYLDFDPEDYVKVVMSEMRHLANNGSVAVRSGWRSLGMDKHPGRKDEEHFEFVLPGFRCSSSRPCCEDMMRPGAIEVRTFTFRWEEISSAFVILTPFQVAFLHDNQIHRHTAVDDELIHACGQLDETGIVSALEKGANIHALDECGDSVCSELVGSFNLWWSERKDDDAHNQGLAERLLKLLLDHGADIDLIGVCSETALNNSRLCASWMMELLLRRGANPNEASWIAPGDYPTTPIDDVCYEQSYCRMEGYAMDDVSIPDSYRMERLLYLYGAGAVIDRNHGNYWMNRMFDGLDVNTACFANLSSFETKVVRAVQRLATCAVSAFMMNGATSTLKDALGRNLVRIAMEDSRITYEKTIREWPQAYHFDLTNFILFLIGYARIPMDDEDYRWLVVFCRDHGNEELPKALESSPLFGERFRSACS